MSTPDRIDRKALVRRHNVTQTRLDPASPVSVGNGEFAFTLDQTGLQTFPGLYPVGEPGVDRPGTLLGTQSQWAWHSVPPPVQYRLADSQVDYQTDRGPVPYVDMAGSLEGAAEDGLAAGEAWLRANPHRLDLVRAGFSVQDDGGIHPPPTGDISGTTQTLDLWTGVVTSSFSYRNTPAEVQTAVDPDSDTLGVVVRSEALRGGLGISLAFPYGSEEWHNAADWDAPAAHRTEVEAVADGWVVRRFLDETEYRVRITARASGPAQIPAATVSLAGLEPHVLRLSTDASALELTLQFLPGAPDRNGDGPVSAPAVLAASAEHWPRFWNSGGAVQLSDTPDPRAAELERRIVLSQYLTAVNCAGSLPPQETGLTCNSWRGRFHLEMHWWHGAHFAAWNRPELLRRSMGFYQDILPSARQTARLQGYDGVRWPKQVGPDGRESPSTIGPFLIWQQPHPIYLAELLYRAEPSPALLAELAGVVEQTARFMASYARPGSSGYTLGPPLVPAQESYADQRADTANPTFELAYWQWALRVANQWRQRLGQERVALWDRVAEGMKAPTVRGGVYTAVDADPFTIREDHPSMLCALGFLPQTDLIDPDVMQATLADVLADWNWKSTWGWDYPVIAMTAARLLNPETAVDALLLDAEKNTSLPNGHNRQTDQLPLYLPGNGALLSAVALMAAGWDGGPERHAPGFPLDWTVQVEGLPPAP